MKKRFIIIIIMLYLYIPLAITVGFSFTDRLSMSFGENSYYASDMLDNPISIFGLIHLSNYQLLFSNSDLLFSLLNSLLIAFISSLIAMIIGLLIALSIFYMKNKKLKKNMLFINNIMFISPDIVIGVSLLLLFSALSIKLGFYSVLLAHIIFGVPVVVIMVLAKLSEINLLEIRASYDLGASNNSVIFKVLIPQITNSLIFSFFLIFTYSLDDFGVTYFVTGNGFTTLPIEIYSMVRRGVGLDINALFSIILMVIIIFIVIYYVVFERRKKK